MAPRAIRANVSAAQADVRGSPPRTSPFRISFFEMRFEMTQFGR